VTCSNGLNFQCDRDILAGLTFYFLSTKSNNFICNFYLSSPTESNLVQPDAAISQQHFTVRFYGYLL